MDIGIGLPANLPGTTPEALLTWARLADTSGFASLAVVDRIVYDNYEPLVTLAAAAAVTTHINLITSVLLAPVRMNAALLAKQVATVNRISGGRLMLGLAPGGREDDYAVSGASFAERGATFDLMLNQMTEIWSGETGIGPHGSAPRLILGGFAPKSFRRAATHGSGWISGADGPTSFHWGAGQLRDAWRLAGRTPEPELIALCYFALGDHAEKQMQTYVRDYYSFDGSFVESVIAASVTSEDSIRRALDAYRSAGATQVLLHPLSTDPVQVELLADIVLDRYRD